MKAKRIVFKVGTSSLTNPDGSLSRQKVKVITQQLALLHESGHELILVSSGAVAAGFGALGFKKRPTRVADKQASAALSVLLNRGAIPIINENDTVSIAELKVGDNDTLSAQVAAMAQADLLVLLTDVDGLYTANPSQDPTAKRLERIEHISREMIEMAGGAGSSNGTGGMLTKLKAATLATESGVPVYICSSLKPDALIEAAQEQADGSYFLAEDKGLKTQKQWLAFYAESKGALWVDAGAAEALLQYGKSLLISGVTKAEGDFSYHDIVSVYHQESGQLLGKGKVRLGQSAVRDLLQSKKAKGILIHRDDWISVTPEIDLLFTEF